MTIIKTRLSEKDFINANMVLLYKKPMVRIFTAIAIIFLLFALFTLITNPQYASISVLLAPVIIGGITPLMTFINAKRMYRVNTRTREQIDYEFQNDLFVIRGESFNAQLTWNKIYKVTATKKWLFIWQNSQAANPILKKDIWEGEIMKLKEILAANGVKNNL
jgi:hypothetical protein